MATTADQPLTAPDPRRWAILAVVVMAQLMVVLDASIVTIALPSAQRSLHISVANRQWVITAYTLAFGGLLLLGGRIADFRGRKRMFVVGLIGFAAASALGGLATTQALLFGARALQGAFAALMAPAALSILTITFQSDPKERAQAFGAYGAVSGAGGAIGVLLGGLLTQYASWRWCLLVNVPIALLTAFAALRVVHESRVDGGTRYDVLGAFLSTAGLVSLVYGFTKAESAGWGASSTVVFLTVAVILLLAFVVTEARSNHPLLPLRVITERNRAGAYLASLLTGAGLFAMFVFLSYYLQSVLHYSALKAGIAFLPFAAGIILAATASSVLVPKIGPRVPMAAGLLVGAVGLAWFEPDRGDHAVLESCPPPGAAHEHRTRPGLPRLQQHRAHQRPRRGLRCGQRPGQHLPAGRRLPRDRPAQHHRGHGHGQLPGGPRPVVGSGRHRARVLPGLPGRSGHAGARRRGQCRVRHRPTQGSPDRGRPGGGHRLRTSSRPRSVPPAFSPFVAAVTTTESILPPTFPEHSRSPR